MPNVHEPTRRAKTRRSPVAVGVLCLWGLIVVFAGGAVAYRYQTAYTRAAIRTFGDKHGNNIRHIDVLPLGVRLTRSADIAAVRRWLIGARRVPSGGTHLRPPVTELRIEFGDGTVERVEVDTALLVLDGALGDDPVVRRIHWRGYTREVDGGEFGRLIQANSTAGGPPATRPTAAVTGP